MSVFNIDLPHLELLAVHKSYRRGKCPKSPFADGGHRVGLVPVLSLLDGGLPGDSAMDWCLHCDKQFERPQRWFIPKKQPRFLPTPTGPAPKVSE